MTWRALAAAAAGVLCWTGVASAQSWRPYSTFRQFHGETKLRAQLEFAAGLLKVMPGRDAELYRMHLSYDADRFVPLSQYQARASTVRLGVESAGRAGLRVVSKNQLRQKAVVELSPKADLALDLNLGAGEADVDLGGLRIASVRLETGASRASIRFSAPNRTRCRSAVFAAGAADLSVLRLGNSRCERVKVEGGVGKLTLDFGGAWTTTQKADLTLAMGELRLRLPKRAPVRITMAKFLASFEPEGLVRRGASWATRDFEPAQPHLDIALTCSVGAVRVEWVN
ncbi:MAG: toast rack family protein [Gemmatimonadales bacterium]